MVYIFAKSPTECSNVSTNEACPYFKLSILNLEDKCDFVKVLAVSLVYVYRLSEHSNLTSTNHHLKNDNSLLKDFKFEDYPFTVEMNASIRNSRDFKLNNPKINMDEYFKIVDEPICSDIGEFVLIDDFLLFYSFC